MNGSPCVLGCNVICSFMKHQCSSAFIIGQKEVWASWNSTLRMRFLVPLKVMKRTIPHFE